ncbi:hypothetical protein ANMWB30_14780 [Arthrobacter sp. MWB30]|nr:hypothetical protein ANMWB30_14780 [Arthrobacter sp. MWB30]
MVHSAYHRFRRETGCFHTLLPPDVMAWGLTSIGLLLSVCRVKNLREPPRKRQILPDA